MQVEWFILFILELLAISMVAMAGNLLPSLGRVRLTDLVACEGLPSDSYKMSASTLIQSFAQYSAAIIELPTSSSALLRSDLESARLYFHHHAYSSSDMSHTNETREWCRTSGYYADPQLWQEIYDYRPGLTDIELSGAELPPSGLPDIFAVLGKAARDILDAISFSLNLRSLSFSELLDNIPLRSREISSSVLSVCCHSRPTFGGAQNHSLTTQENGQLVMLPESEDQVDKALITIVKPDKAGLHIKDFNGHWILVDGDLGPLDAIVYPGLALYQATAGYLSPAIYKIEIDNLQGNIYGRCSLSFKLMPRSMASLSCSEMKAAGHWVEAQFQSPIPVDEFMQRPHSSDQLSRTGYPNSTMQVGQDASFRSLIKGKKSNARNKALPPSKRLRLEAQRVLKERVQEIADKKGIKLKFCNIKECEGHMMELDSPCGNIRMELGWPPGVPFVHPHDLPNKAKLGFLEAYEPGWAVSQQDMEESASIAFLTWRICLLHLKKFVMKAWLESQLACGMIIPANFIVSQSYG